uniref:Unannotated protein n=1 Tax=freshwater metagenome TaxID=449393 RepID=A0A6J5ZXA6_9ZZZZ
MIASKRIMRNEFRPQMENVWDYPRPPRVEPSKRRAKVELGGQTIADSDRALRVLETSHPPVIYIPAEDFADGSLSPSNAGRSFCEFKGFAEYLDITGADTTALAAGWTYPAPTKGFEALAGHVAVYPEKMGRCLLDDEVVRAQEGDFYGGWVTDDIAGPLKGGPGTRGW